MTHTAVSQANSALQLPTLEHVYALLKANCKPDRFDGRDGPVWGQEYSWNLAKAYRIWRNTVRHMSPVMKTVWGKDLVLVLTC